MEALLCEQEGHPSSRAGRTSGPWKTELWNSDSWMTASSHWHSTAQKTCLPALQQHLPDQPQVAVRHFSLAALNKTKNKKNPKWFDILKYHLRLTSSNRFGIPFSEGPWLLVWGTEEGWVCISGFCQWSSSGFHQWTVATMKQTNQDNGQQKWNQPKRWV